MNYLISFKTVQIAFSVRKKEIRLSLCKIIVPKLKFYLSKTLLKKNNPITDQYHKYIQCKDINLGGIQRKKLGIRLRIEYPDLKIKILSRRKNYCLVLTM
jgi:hypothetical protein